MPQCFLWQSKPGQRQTARYDRWQYKRIQKIQQTTTIYSKLETMWHWFRICRKKCKTSSLSECFQLVDRFYRCLEAKLAQQFTSGTDWFGPGLNNFRISVPEAWSTDWLLCFLLFHDRGNRNAKHCRRFSNNTKTLPHITSLSPSPSMSLDWIADSPRFFFAIDFGSDSVFMPCGQSHWQIDS